MLLRTLTSFTFLQFSWECLPRQNAQFSISCLVCSVVFPVAPLVRLSLWRNTPGFWSRGPAIADTACSWSSLSSSSFENASSISSIFQLRKSVPRVMVSRKASGNLFSTAGTTTAENVLSSTPSAFSPRKCDSQPSYNFLSRDVSLSLNTGDKFSRSFT